MQSLNITKISNLNYLIRTASGLDRYFLEIEDWLDEDKSLHQNTPLVLEADYGIGKKTLLVKWMEYHAKNKKGVICAIIVALLRLHNSTFCHIIW